MGRITNWLGHVTSLLCLFALLFIKPKTAPPNSTCYGFVWVNLKVLWHRYYYSHSIIGCMAASRVKHCHSSCKKAYNQTCDFCVWSLVCSTGFANKRLPINTCDRHGNSACQLITMDHKLEAVLQKSNKNLFIRTLNGMSARQLFKPDRTWLSVQGASKLEKWNSGN